MFKEKFPIFQNKDLVFLDSAASTQKPLSVLKALTDFYAYHYSNVHRGSCHLATDATIQYEAARKKVASFIHTNERQIVFTKGATESINLVANGFKKLLKEGDEILVCIAEHHANFVPWQQIAKETGAHFITFDVLDNGEIDLEDFYSKLNNRTKLVAVAQLSNVLGVKNPIEVMIKKAHEKGAMVLIDGAQSIAHQKVDVAKMDADFFVFSGHKLYAPTGIGVLYGKKEALEMLSPYQYGGDMVRTVKKEETIFKEIPYKFEAGTPPFAEAVTLGAAIDFLKEISMDTLELQEIELTQYLIKELNKIPSVNILAPNENKQGIVAFNVLDIHPTDIALTLAEQNICVRVGHHCAMPLHTRFNTDISLRVSLGLYNDKEDIDLFITALKKGIDLFKGLNK